MRRNLLLFLTLAGMAYGRGVYSGWCERGGGTITINGSSATAKAQASFPACTVTVRNSSGTLASIYADDAGTILANPFTANGTPSLSAGLYTFFADGGNYTVTLSGAGIAAPFSVSVTMPGAGSGSGITSLNGLTYPTQLMDVGTAGTDFAISSASSTHTFNLPTATSVNRGALSASDWSLFNGKQSALSFTSPLVNTAGTVALTLPLSVGQGGTGQITQTPAFNALSPLTTAGDLLAFNGTNNVRIPIGTNGFCLTTDTGQATKLSWAPCATGGGGSVLSVGTTAPLTGGVITTTGTIACPTCGVTGNPLSQFASTSSAQLATVMSDESGTGLLIFGTNATLVTPTVASFINATHDHSNAAGGGNVSTTAVASGNKEGNGIKFQIFTGADPATDDCAKFDANHNIVSAGAACGTAGGAITALTGDVAASGTGSITATLLNIPTAVPMAGYLAATAIAAPGTPGAGVGRMYVDSTSKNLSIKDDAGVVKHGVQTKASVSNSFATAISDAGVVTVAQPTLLNLTTFSSANLATQLTDETGTGLAVFGTSPTIITPTVASFANANHSHQNSAGGGTLAESALALTDITTNNATASAHGFLPKLSGSAADCFLGDGTYGSCAGVGGGANTTLSNLGTTNLNSSLLFQASLDVGSTAKPVRNLFLYGAGTYSTTYIELTGTPTSTRVLTLPDATDTLVGKATADTLTNKTLTLPVISSISNGGTITIPSGTDTLVGKATTDTLTNKTLTAPVIATIVNSGTLTLPTSTTTLVGRTTTDTLTNKTLTSPVIATIVNTGTLTLPTSTDTLVGKATADTLTNKTFNTAGTGNNFSINSVAITGVEGNSAKVALFTGSDPATNDCAKFDSSHNLVTAGAACGGNPVTLTTVTFSATPTFTRTTQIQEWALTLTGNVSGSTLSGGTAADIYIFNICQDATGGRTFAWPAGFTQATTPVRAASVCTKQTFYWSGAAAIALTPGVSTGTTTVFPPLAFASLPTCDSTVEGALQPVTDSATATWGATVTGGSTNHVMAYCNSANWTVMGK